MERRRARTWSRAIESGPPLTAARTLSPRAKSSSVRMVRSARVSRVGGCDRLKVTRTPCRKRARRFPRAAASGEAPRDSRGRRPGAERRSERSPRTRSEGQSGEPRRGGEHPAATSSASLQHDKTLYVAGLRKHLE